MAGPVGMDPAPFVRDLTVRDIDNLAWSGDSGHREHMVSELERVPAGEIEYLVVALPDSGPAGEERLVGKGAINYVQAPGCGVLTQRNASMSALATRSTTSDRSHGCRRRPMASASGTTRPAPGCAKT